MKKQLLAIFSLFLCCMEAMAQTGPQVTYRDGTVEGIDSSGVKIFRGVPFAQPPVGNLRWRGCLCRRRGLRGSVSSDVRCGSCRFLCLL